MTLVANGFTLIFFGANSPWETLVFRLMLCLRYVVVNPCFVYGYETDQRFVQIAVETNIQWSFKIKFTEPCDIPSDPRSAYKLSWNSFRCSDLYWTSITFGVTRACANATKFTKSFFFWLAYHERKKQNPHRITLLSVRLPVFLSRPFLTGKNKDIKFKLISNTRVYSPMKV